jgi:CHAD domain-containing protein
MSQVGLDNSIDKNSITMEVMISISDDTGLTGLAEQPALEGLPLATRLLRDGLFQRWGKFTLRLERCQADLSEENVHDLRVSMRRLLAMLVMCRAVMPELKTKGLRREIKSHLDNLDALRDTHVMQLYVRKYLRKNESAVPLETFLAMQETHLLRQLGYEINRIFPGQMSEKIDALSRSLENTLTGTGVAGQILAGVDEAYANVLWRQVNIDPANLASVHAMRIAFKKFRYMLEVANPLVPPMPPSRPRVLHHYQGMMGDIQDVVVMLTFIDRFALENPQFDVAPVRTIVVQKLDERMVYFLSRINRLKQFWRKSPTIHFPWRVSSIEPSVVNQEEEDE